MRELPDQTGRTAVVTGANSGLGLEIATRLSAAGASVVLACRNPARAAVAVERVRDVATAGTVTTGVLDLADLGSVRAFAADLLARHDRLDLLVNNAGLMAVDRGETADGVETHFGVNHLGHFALTQLLLPALQDVPGSRVGTMTSLVHRFGRIGPDPASTRRYHRWPAYARSKLANLLFTVALQDRLGGAGRATIAVAAHPGATSTDLGAEGHAVGNQVVRLALAGAQPVRAGALPMLRALTDPTVHGGELYGPRLVMSGAPVRERPARRGRDRAEAERLWALSARLTGLDAFA